ncbi:Lrp/AsnC family transcriptional regulator [Bradyrhizobium manausense]|uniref:Lrp/AsnC family transcriptional regulator n=1 Tax=Bradyrhizobium TaxID=374 RepID=UPI001BABDFB7|nr:MULTISPECIES: Lrp/AsnC family transcriptional regulator [Bradyrhizobium]MBR0828479.1 Lrp/AsnC family transcriptional regulator [Bradyrhizobium manausense]UVO25460.1 Lrp/AsnC family transcriptional regulator [Bradyrhizobium arachidis]
MAERDQLDSVDLRILSELQADGRVRNNELALRVGVSAPNCVRRLKSLFRRGVVKAVRAVIDERLLGYEVVSFVAIQLGSQAQPVLEAFETSIATVPRIQQCWRISGDTDYLLKCVAPSVESMRQQLLHFAALPNVKNVRSFPVLGVAKDVPLPVQEIPSAGMRVGQGAG